MFLEVLKTQVKWNNGISQHQAQLCWSQWNHFTFHLLRVWHSINKIYNASLHMWIQLDKHMFLLQIWWYKHTSILKYKVLEKKDIYLDYWERKRKNSDKKKVNKATSNYNGQIYFSSQIIIQFLADLIFPSGELFIHNCFLLELIWSSLIWKTNSYLTIHKYSLRGISSSICAELCNVYLMLKLIFY